jgi:polysaccharide biosynthesis/export protein
MVKKTQVRAFYILAVICGALSAGCRTRIPAEPLSSAPKGSTFNLNGEYNVGARDVLKVSVLGDATFTGDYPVSDEGKILLPVVGQISVGGQSLMEIQAELASKIISYVQRPNISLSLVSRESYRAFFVGEFARIGPVQLRERSNLLNGIIFAGGLTPFANGRIVLIRAGKDGRSGRYAVDYSDLKDGLRGSDQFILERDDVLVAE